MRLLNNPRSGTSGAPSSRATSCAEGCESCPLGNPTPREDAPYEGVRFGLISLAYFVVPAVVALVAGALLGRLGPDYGALGAVGGIAGGMIACVWAARRFGPRLAKQGTRPGAAKDCDLSGEPS